MVYPGQLIVNRYRIEQLIEKDTTSNLFRAEDLTLDRHVALKVLNTQSYHVINAFLAQAQYAASLKHPNYLEPLNFHSDRRLSYMAMLYPDGGFLSELISSGKSQLLSLDVILNYFRQMVAGVNYAHLHDLACSDLQPKNIWFLDKLQQRIVLADTTLVKTHSHLTVPSMYAPSGSISYHAPERWHGQLGKPSDIFTLGIILFELLTGDVHYNDLNLKLKKLDYPSMLPDLLESRPDLPPGLVHLVELLTDHSPENRPTASEVLELMNGLLAEQVVSKSLPLIPPVTTPTASSPLQSGSKVNFSKFGNFLQSLSLKSGMGLLQVGMAVLMVGVLFWMSNPIPSKQPMPVIHSGTIASVAYSPDGWLFASASDDLTIKLSETKDYKEVATFRPQETVFSVAFSPDSKFLASGGTDKTIKLWDVASKQQVATLMGHLDTIFSVAFSPDGKYLVSGGKDKTVKLWDVATRQIAFTLVGHTDAVTTVAFDPLGKTIASSSKDKTIKIWSVDNSKELITLKGHTDAVLTLAFSPNGKYLASGGNDNSLQLWNTADYSELAARISNGELNHSISYSPLITRISTMREEYPGYPVPVTALAFSPDSRLLVTASTNRIVTLWETNGLKVVDYLQKDAYTQFFSVTFSPDGHYIVAGSKPFLLLWKLKSFSKE